MSESAYPGIVPEHRPNGDRTHCVADGESWPCGNGPYGQRIEPRRLQRELRERELLLAAIVTQYGDALGGGRYDISVDPAHLETADARRLTLIVDPNSGAALLRVRPL